MEVHELAPGLRYWLAPHPDWDPTENWPEDVLCVYHEAPDAVVLFDPLVPRGEEERFWRALDADVARLGRPVTVLLTAPWHARDAGLLAERYGTSVRRPGDGLPAGVEALVPEGKEDGQALFFLREHRALVTGDVLSGTGGRFHVFVSEHDPDRPAFLEWLTTLLELPVERVLVAHGDPVLEDGAARLREAVARARSGTDVTPVREALYRGDREAAEAAATYALDVFDAAALGRLDRLRELLDGDPGLAGAFSEDGFTPLHLACFSGGASAVRLLVERGAPLEAVARSSFAPVRPLGTAAFRGDLECAGALLDAGADPNGAGGDGHVPLHTARATGDEAMERLLRAHGAGLP